MLKLLSWSSAGGLLGVLLGIRGVGNGTWQPIMIPLLFVLAWGITFMVPWVLVTVSGGAAGAWLAPSGRSTPKARGYSHAESLVARGRYAEAVDAYERAIAEDPKDPRPYLEVARLHRDRLDRLEEAAAWFKRALQDSDADPGLAGLVRRELFELYVVRMQAPEKAAPFLARAAEELAGTAEGAWAAEKLTEVRGGIARRSESD